MTAGNYVRMADAGCRTRPGSRGGRIAAFSLDLGCCAVLYDGRPNIVILRLNGGGACLIIESWDREPQSLVLPDAKAGEEAGCSPHVADGPGRRRGRHPHAAARSTSTTAPSAAQYRPAPPTSKVSAGAPATLAGPAMAASSWARAFPGTHEQVRIARRFVASLLDGSQLRDDAVYAASELFANGVLHTASGRPGGLIVVQVTRWLFGVRIAVTDQGSVSAPQSAKPSRPASSPRTVPACTPSASWPGASAGTTIPAAEPSIPRSAHRSGPPGTFRV